MLRPRIIPSLLIHKGGLVKTFQFKNSKYIGDPINAVRIFNEKMVDEIIILDIDKTVKKEEPNYSLIEKIARECRMPLCYGGGIKKISQVEKLVSLGVEKVSMSSIALEDPNFINEAVKQVGSQSIVICLDIKRTGLLGNNYSIFTHNSTYKREIEPLKFIDILQEYGAGEILINMIDRDGMQKGYDLEFIEKVKKNVSIPLSVLGGASSYRDFDELISRFGIIGCSAGSIFVLKGKYKAVLIQYPNSNEKEEIMRNFFLKN